MRARAGRTQKQTGNSCICLLGCLTNSGKSLAQIISGFRKCELRQYPIESINVRVPILTCLKGYPHALNAGNIADPNEVAEMIQKFVCRDVLHDRCEIVHHVVPFTNCPLAKEPLDRPRLRFLGVARALGDIAPYITDDGNCTVKNTRPFSALVIRVKLSTVIQSGDLLLCEADCSFDAGAIGVLLSFSINDVSEQCHHADAKSSVPAV